MHYDVIQVKPLGHLRLAISFRDGLRGEVELRESHLYGVFEALKDPELFQHVHCNQGFVEWPARQAGSRPRRRSSPTRSSDGLSCGPDRLRAAWRARCPHAAARGSGHARTRRTRP